MVLGGLYHAGFPVEDPRLYETHNGHDYNDYSSRREVVEQMAIAGYVKWSEYYDFDCPSLDHPDFHNIVVEWGMLEIMRKIVDSGVDTLVLENDAFFKNIDYETIVGCWMDLVRIVPYDEIHIAMLMHYPAHNQPLLEGERVNVFWQRGSRQPGQVANIYTPQGAKWILEEKPAFPTIEQYLYDFPDTPGLFSSYDNYVQFNTPFSFDSPFDPRFANKESLLRYYRGE